jgi:hypothetical protein
MSAVQLQDIIGSVKVVQAEISKQTELQTAALSGQYNCLILHI